LVLLAIAATPWLTILAWFRLLAILTVFAILGALILTLILAFATLPL
jgi:hypothetical protein